MSKNHKFGKLRPRNPATISDYLQVLNCTLSSPATDICEKYFEFNIYLILFKATCHFRVMEQKTKRILEVLEVIFYDACCVMKLTSPETYWSGKLFECKMFDSLLLEFQNTIAPNYSNESVELFPPFWKFLSFQKL